MVSGAVRWCRVGWCVGCGCVGAGRAVPRAPERRARRPPPSRRRAGASDRSCVVPGHQLTLGRSCCDRKPRHDTSRRGATAARWDHLSKGSNRRPLSGARGTARSPHDNPRSRTALRHAHQGRGSFRGAAPPGGSRPSAQGAVSGFPIAARPPMGTQKAEDDTAAIGCPVAAPTRQPHGRRVFQGREERRDQPTTTASRQTTAPHPQGRGELRDQPPPARTHPRPDRTTP